MHPAPILTALLKRFLSAFFLMALAVASLAQEEKFVSVNGDDANDGSLRKPFKTLQHAMALVSGQTGKNVTIRLRQGTYYLSEPIDIQAASFKPASLLIASYGNEQPTISAGTKLQLRWTLFRNGVYMASVPESLYFERLYVNGQLQRMARYPNYDSAAKVFHGTSPDAIAPERVKRWKNPVGGYVHALHEDEWGGFHYRITGVDSSGNLQLEGGWQNNRPSKMHPRYRFVENIFEELDTAGEWYLDSSKHTLYYYPEKGTGLDQATIEVSQIRNSFELSGTEDHPLKNISFKGLHFAHNERSFMYTKEPLLRSDWTIYRGGAILLSGTEHCTVSDCVFEGIGGNAIMVSGYNKEDTITGCHIHHIGANAICLIGETNAVRSPSFRYENYVPYQQLDTVAGPANNHYPQRCLVSDNLLHDLGEIEKQATGVEIQTAAFITVRHNTIYNTSRAGINIGDGSFGGHVLEYNDVFNTVQETGDHGSFNSWGRDRYWAPNRKYMDSLAAVHPELVLLDAQNTTIIRNNRFRCDHGWDIDLDDGSSNYHVYNNLCLNGGIKLREGFHRVVENNVMVNNSFHPHVWFKNSGDVFMHNIVMKKYAPIEITDWGKHIDHNFFTDSAALKDAQGNGTDGNSLAGDPLFTNPAKGDFSVRANSPALKAGFRNFDMHSFGVQKPALKKLAQQHAIPALLNTAGLSDKSVVMPFLGGTVKSVQGLGDRSAYGLPDETGVVIMSAPVNSLLAKSGLEPRDVMRTVNGHPVTDIKELLDAYQSLSWKPTIPVTIIRNQQPADVVLQTK